MIPILFGDVFSNSVQRITTKIRYPNPIPLIIVRIKAARSVFFILEIIPFIGIPKSSPEASIISRKISLTYPHFIHNKHGFVFDDSNELIHFINETLNNKKLRMQFSKNLSKLATEQPSWESYSKSINKLLLK